MKDHCRLLLIILASVYSSAAFAQSSPDTVPAPLPLSDRAFATTVLNIAVAGRPLSQVIREFEANGFTCIASSSEKLSNSDRTVFYERHNCGAAIPALHGCARNATLGAFDGILKHIQISLEHPAGSEDVGVACGR